MKTAKNIFIIIVGIILVSIVYSFSIGKTDTSVKSNVEQNRLPGTLSTTPAATEGDLVTTKIDQGASASDIKLVPVAVLEDSRCPMNARCVWAGRVRIEAIVMDGTGTPQKQEFTLGESKMVFNKEIVLVGVRPEMEMGAQLSPQLYEFDFEIR